MIIYKSFAVESLHHNLEAFQIFKSFSLSSMNMIGLAHPDPHQESSIWHKLLGKSCTQNIPTIQTKIKKT
jgi:hypothetical protein